MARWLYRISRIFNRNGLTVVKIDLFVFVILQVLITWTGGWADDSWVGVTSLIVAFGVIMVQAYLHDYDTILEDNLTKAIFLREARRSLRNAYSSADPELLFIASSLKKRAPAAMALLQGQDHAISRDLSKDAFAVIQDLLGSSYTVEDAREEVAYLLNSKNLSRKMIKQIADEIPPVFSSAELAEREQQKQIAQKVEQIAEGEKVPGFHEKSLTRYKKLQDDFIRNSLDIASLDPAAKDAAREFMATMSILSAIKADPQSMGTFADLVTQAERQWAVLNHRKEVYA